MVFGGFRCWCWFAIELSFCCGVRCYCVLIFGGLGGLLVLLIWFWGGFGGFDIDF